MKKRMLAMLLSVVMVLGMLPATALAGEPVDGVKDTRKFAATFDLDAAERHFTVSVGETPVDGTEFSRTEMWVDNGTWKKVPIIGTEYWSPKWEKDPSRTDSSAVVTITAESGYALELPTIVPPDFGIDVILSNQYKDCVSAVTLSEDGTTATFTVAPPKMGTVTDLAADKDLHYTVHVATVKLGADRYVDLTVTDGGSVTKQDGTALTAGENKLDCGNVVLNLVPAAGYAVESVTLDGEPLTVTDGKITLAEVETTEDIRQSLAVSFAKKELTLKSTTYEVTYSEGREPIADKAAFAQTLIGAMVDFEHSFPGLTAEEVTVKYKAGSTDLTWHELTFVPNFIEAATQHAFGKNEVETIRFTTADGRTAEAEVTFTAIPLPASSIVVNQPLTMTYSPDAKDIADVLYRNIDWTASVLPEGLTQADFTYEYQCNIADVLSTVAGITIPDSITIPGINLPIEIPTDMTNVWVDVNEGSTIGAALANVTVDLPVVGTVNLGEYLIENLGISEEVLNQPITPYAGESRGVKITWAGNDDFKGSEWTGTITITKAPSETAVKTVTITYPEKAPADLVTFTSNGVPASVNNVVVYVGLDTKNLAFVSVQLPNGALYDAVEALFPNGFTLSEISTVLEMIGQTVDDATLNQILGAIPDAVKNFTVHLGDQPENVGAYLVAAVTVDPNYETSYGVGLLTILPQTNAMEAKFNGEVPTLFTKSDMENYDFSGRVVYTGNGETVEGMIPNSLYFGVTADGALVFEDNMDPAALQPGVYTQVLHVDDFNTIVMPAARVFTLLSREAASITVNSQTIQWGDKIPADLVVTNPEDRGHIDLYVGITNSVDYVVKLGGEGDCFETIKAAYPGGFSLADLGDILKNAGLDITAEIVKQIQGYLPEGVGSSVKVTGYVEDPLDAGIYTVIAVLADDEYYPAVGAGMLLVEAKDTNYTVEFYEDLPEFIPVSELKDHTFGGYIKDDAGSEVPVKVLYNMQALDPTALAPGFYTESVFSADPNLSVIAKHRTFWVIRDDADLVIDDQREFVYNGQPQAPGAQLVGGDGAVIPNACITYTYWEKTFEIGGKAVYMPLPGKPTNVGEYKVKAIYWGSLNNQCDMGIACFKIVPATLTVTMDDQVKYQGEPDPVFTYTVTPDGLLGRCDKLTVKPYREPGEAPGQYPISAKVCSSSKNFNVTVVDGTLTIIAAYTLTFDANGGAWPTAVIPGYTPGPGTQSKRLPAGTVLEDIIHPSKPGCTFAGWFLGDDEIPFGFARMPAEDTTLTAHWTEIEPEMVSYQLYQHFVSGTEEVIGFTGSAVLGTDIAGLYAGMAEDQIFHGDPYTFRNVVVAPAIDTLTESVKIDLYYDLAVSTDITVKFVAPGAWNDGVQHEFVLTEDGKLYTAPVDGDFALDANRFLDDWMTADGKYTMEPGIQFNYGDMVTITAPGSTIVFYAVLTDNTVIEEPYIVTFDYNYEGVFDKYVAVKAGETVAEEPASRAGYTFGGWYTDAECTVKYDFTTPVNSDITLYAKWTKNPTPPVSADYTLAYDTNGGKKLPSESKDHSWTKDFDSLPIPTRSGYRFTGWYHDAKLTDKVTGDVKVDKRNGTVTLYADWTETTVPGGLNGKDHFAYVQGYDDGTVRPEAYVTRAHAATIFFRLLEDEVRDGSLTSVNSFSDLATAHWANTAISTMTELGIVKGRNDGTFDPEAPITRAEFAAICAHFDHTKLDAKHNFSDIGGHWAEDEIARAVALGWLSGYDDGTFRPNEYITRAQAMTLINRVLCRLPEKASDLLTGMNVWPDCDAESWYYLAVQEATNSHDYTNRGVYENWTKLIRDPDWSRYEH